MTDRPARTNASTIRTRRRIHESFLGLAEERDVSAISVNDVTRAAGLNRTTFYLHYPDIAALLDAVIDELAARLEEGGLKVLDWQPGPGVGWQDTFFRTIAERPALFRGLLRGTAREKIEARLLAQHEAWFLARWEREGVEALDGWPDRATCARFAAGGVHALTMAWLEAGMPVSTDVIGAEAYRLGMAVVGDTTTVALPVIRERHGS